MRAIVTGANGFVGSALVKKLVENNIEVLAIDVAFNRKRQKFRATILWHNKYKKAYIRLYLVTFRSRGRSFE